jgi:hypothetical protein
MALICLLLPSLAQAQAVEAVGGRALGMGGAFVAVADDSSASWWNPAGLAVGPFVDVTVGKAIVAAEERLPGWRSRPTWFAVGTPPLAVSVYRFRITDIRASDTKGQPADGRQDTRVGVSSRSLSVTQVGVSVVRTLVPGVHVGSTVKLIRGSLNAGTFDDAGDPAAALERGESFAGGDAHTRFDVDLGVIADARRVRLGAVVRNTRQPEWSVTAPAAEPTTSVALPRQARAGLAVDVSPGADRALVVAVDGDLRAYTVGSGERQVVAVGVESWWLQKRLGVRAGARGNTQGRRERTATVGLSVAFRSGVLVEGHAVGGGDRSERGWGITTRVSY